MEYYWSENIYYVIKGFSNLDEQKKIWLGLSQKLVSSFGEDISSLYDSFSFDDFIEECKKNNINATLLKELILFKDTLNFYIKKVYRNHNNPLPDKYIINDPQWLEIVDLAKKVISLWDRNPIYLAY